MVPTVAIACVALIATSAGTSHADHAPADERRIAIRLEPSQAVWEKGTCITGHAVITNLGTDPLYLGIHDLPAVIMRTLDGASPPALPQPMPLCGTGFAGMGVRLPPMASGRLTFSVETGPEHMDAGYDAPPGVYELHLAPFHEHANLTIADAPPAPTVTIVPQPRPDEPGPPVQVAASSDHLVVLRRDGTIDRFNIHDMTLIARARIEGWALPNYLSSFDFVFSPDLASVAWAEPDFENDRTMVHVAQIPLVGGHAAAVLPAIQAVAALQGKSPFVAGFDSADGGVFVGEYEGTLLKLDAASGREVQRWNLGGRPVVSPDGRHIGWERRAYEPYYTPDPRRGPPTHGWGPHADPNRFLGYDGGYEFDLIASGVVLDAGHGGWQLRSYDDRPIHNIPATDNGWLIAASPDGRTFVYRENVEPDGDVFRTEFRHFEFGHAEPRWIWTPDHGVPEIEYVQDGRFLILTYDRRGGYRHWLEDTIELIDVETGQITRRIVIPRPGIDEAGLPKVEAHAGGR